MEHQQHPMVPPSTNGINQQVKPQLPPGVMDGIQGSTPQGFVPQPQPQHVHYHHVDPNMQRKGQVVQQQQQQQVMPPTGAQMPPYYYAQQPGAIPYYAVPGQPYGMSPQSFPYAPYGYQYPYGQAYPYASAGHPHTVPPNAQQVPVTTKPVTTAVPTTTVPTPKQKKKKVKTVNQSNAIFPGQSKSLCPNDAFNVGRKNDFLYLVGGFTMDRVLQNICVHIGAGNEVSISEKQVLKIDISSLEGKSLKIQIYICQLNVDKIQDTTTPLHLFMEYPVNSEEIEFEDLSFTYQPNSSNSRSVHFLRFVLLETVDNVDKVINFCDSCNFMISTPTTKKKKQSSSSQAAISTPVQHVVTPNPTPLPVQQHVTPTSLTKTPPKGGEAPTVEFLKRLISTAPRKEHLSHWNNFMVTLDQLNVYDGNFLKKAEDISDSIKRGGRFSVYPCIEQCCPSFGPIRGGIQVSINVKDLDVYDEDDLSIFIDDIRIAKKDITSVRPTKIEFYLPALTGNRIPGQVDVSISVDNGFECYSHALYNSFEYVTEEDFEKRKGSIPMKEKSPNGFVQIVTVKPINGSTEVGEEEYGDINEKIDLYNAESCQYRSCIHFERGFLDSSKIDPKTRFIWVLRRADNLENLYGSQIAPEEHTGVMILKNDINLSQTKMADILEISFEIDRRLTSEKLGVAMALQLYDRETKKYQYTSKALHILSRPPKPVQYSSYNEDERVLQLLDKIKTRKRRRGRNSIVFDPNLNSLGQPMTHALCLSDNETEIEKSFQQYHLDVNDQFNRSPFHLAFAAGNLAAVKFFMEKSTVSPHIYLFQRDCYNQTPFHLAFKFYRTKFLVECCSFLKEKLDKSATKNEFPTPQNGNSNSTITQPPQQPKQDKKRKTPTSAKESTKRTKVEVISSSDDEEEDSAALHLQDEE